MGAGYYISGDFNQKGKVYQYSNPDFYNLNYDYKIQIQQLMCEGKFLTTFNTIYHPYLSGGIGASFNRSHKYHETPIHSYAVADYPFASLTQSNFAYSAGVGLDIEISSKWRVGGGYEYSNLGTVKLGNSPAQITSEHVSSGIINASKVLIQVSYTI